MQLYGDFHCQHQLPRLSKSYLPSRMSRAILHNVTEEIAANAVCGIRREQCIAQADARTSQATAVNDVIPVSTWSRPRDVNKTFA